MNIFNDVKNDIPQKAFDADIKNKGNLLKKFHKPATYKAFKEVCACTDTPYEMVIKTPYGTYTERTVRRREREINLFQLGKKTYFQTEEFGYIEYGFLNDSFWDLI